ncbi:unnamed protein product [Rotaria magnacalcarata]|uniref:Uncharacterized protein n=3 Tax=Rotaria magnacalcarata TaxID=392030 RepID=A0A816CML6_9BILA|nr:unnamed protein product [Rotaria magnacalcarata]CAF2033733.1 unnamed protein product [Rotaria magnacalcarata]
MAKLTDSPFNIRVTQYSAPHSVIPPRYIEPWRRDIVNRELIINNAHQGNIPHYEHDDALYFNKREQMYYNVEPRDRVDKKYTLPSRSDQLQPRFHEIYDRHRSSLLSRYDPQNNFKKK